MSSDGDNSSTTSTPTDAMMQLLRPDGYYTYLGILRDHVDEDLIKKNYRRLSLKHHPDRNGGDAETFRILNRAQLVLTTPKLRQQYDILGLDLDDEGEEKDTETADGPTTSQGIVHEMASMALTSVLQMGVRTRKSKPNPPMPFVTG